MKTINKDNVMYFRDAFIPEKEAKINVISTSVQYGLNVFEGIRAYYNCGQKQLFIFRLSDHIKRLFRSAKLLHFELDTSLSYNVIEAKILEVIKMNDFKEDIYIRVSLFLDNDLGWSSTKPVSLIVSAFPRGRAFTDVESISCCVSSWRRINDGSFPPRIKAGPNYLNSRLAMMEAKNNGFDYCILLNDRQSVSEGPGACLFIVRDGMLITPPLYASILESINRDSFLEMASSMMGIVCAEREIDRTELYIADEAFMVGTAIEIRHVGKIDHITINDGKIGPITKRLFDAYFKLVRNEVKEYRKWLTPVY